MNSKFSREIWPNQDFMWRRYFSGVPKKKIRFSFCFNLTLTHFCSFHKLKKSHSNIKRGPLYLCLLQGGCQLAARSTPSKTYPSFFFIVQLICRSAKVRVQDIFLTARRMLGRSLTQMRSHLGFCWLCFSCFCIPTRKKWFRATRVAQRNKGRPLAV